MEQYKTLSTAEIIELVKHELAEFIFPKILTEVSLAGFGTDVSRKKPVARVA